MTCLRSFRNKVKMLKNIILLVFAKFVIQFGAASFIHPCHISYENCLKAAQAAIPLMASGIPALGMDPLDPLLLSRIRSYYGTLDLDFVGTKIEGIRKCVLLRISANAKKTKHTVSAKCNITVSGYSNSKGVLAYHSFSGGGHFSIVLDEILIRSVAHLAKVKGMDRKKHYKIVSRKYSFEVPKEPRFKFRYYAIDDRYTNETTLDKFFHCHWKEAVREFVPPLIRATMAKIYDIIAKFFQSKPISELSLN